MIKALKIRLFPTKEQEVLMLKTIGCCRFTYNWALHQWKENYEKGQKCSISEIRKQFTQLKKQEEFHWLNEVSNTSMVEAMRNLDEAFKKFFQGTANHPKFKSKKTSRQSFYVRYDRLYFKQDVCNIEKIGKVKYRTNYQIPIGKYHSPYCSFDGKYWYLTFGVEVGENQVDLTQDLSIGIDLGLKELAVVSVLDKPIKNINKTQKVRKLKKKLKRLQKQVSRKYRMNQEETKFVKTKNIIKLEKQIRLIYRKLANIRSNHIHQATNKIIKLRPYRIVMEDLNVKGMMKNRHVSEAIAEQGFGEFIRQMEYKCKYDGIQFVKADRFFPSSKKCSCCGEIKKDLKLKDRVYRCQCGCIMDRDKNASINLSRYGFA